MLLPERYVGMKIIGINACNYGSTGNIMLQVLELARAKGDEAYASFPNSNDNLKKHVDYQMPIGNQFLRDIHIKAAVLTGFNDCFSLLATKRFLSQVEKYNPDIIHLHNSHGWYINLPMLFRYIKKHRIRVVWTLHDCWSFTGHCPHFTMAQCDKWKTGCNNCPLFREYPQSFVDNSRYMYNLKKKWFTGVENMTLVTPSQWLADLVKESYLKDYPVKVIHNGIDLEIFKPTPSNFRKKHAIPDNKYIVLGVAFGWDERKGLDVFVELARRLDTEKYQIVLVGTDDNVDKRLPRSIISIHRTQNQTELAEIYTAADVFANPTREEVLGLVNLEALACGTPVITFKTGGSPECIDETCGVVVDCDDITALVQEIIRICETSPFSQEMCLKRAMGFDKDNKYKEYIALYAKSQ